MTEAEGFCYGAAALIGLILFLFTLGTPDRPRTGHRPPSHPPGWANRKRKK